MKSKNFLFFLPLVLISLSCRKSNDGPRIINEEKDVVLVLNPGRNNPRNSEGDFISLKNGKLLFVYSHFTGNVDHDNSPAYLAGRTSLDSGKTWLNEERIIVPNEGKLNIMSVSLLRLQNGSIALFYLIKNSLEDSRPYLRISNDEGETWSAPRLCITDRVGYYAMNNNRVIQLRTGRIILPVSLHKLEGETTWSYVGRLYSYYSDDNGVTWQRSEVVPNPKKILTQEPGVIELKNGEVLMIIRTNQRYQYLSYSRDQGQTWSTIKSSTLMSPVSPASIARIPSTNDLLVVWNNNNGQNERTKEYRTPYTLAVSKDEGQTWSTFKAIETNEDGVYCYTSIHFIGDHVLLAHSAGRMSKGTGLSILNVTRLSLGWIYN
ncbi:MAG: exo-alpha-sialidase [Chitinophaga sp.]|uniref:sialidase family protein n=1 Tax=Chitinophaga sp. TaxID=1869181 RepID=UPI001B17A299|nr:sialidase family protein [Chitinophaga sp.]MBO9731712.1 exo-alpha-sialidase [Chitinophaga sp.]